MIGVATKDYAAALTAIMRFPAGAIYWMIYETFSKYEALTHRTVALVAKPIQYGPVAHLITLGWGGGVGSKLFYPSDGSGSSNHTESMAV